MPNLENQSSSPDPVTPGGNSVKGVKQPGQEDETESYGYVLEDFSQQKINRGQQTINRLIKEADEKILDALRELSKAVDQLNGAGKVNLKPVNDAIAQVYEATEKVAGPYPPGCGDTYKKEE